MRNFRPMRAAEEESGMRKLRTERFQLPAINDCRSDTVLLPRCAPIGNGAVVRQLFADRWALRAFSSALDERFGAAILTHVPRTSPVRLRTPRGLHSRPREVGFRAAIGYSRGAGSTADPAGRGGAGDGGGMEPADASNGNAAARRLARGGPGAWRQGLRRVVGSARRQQRPAGGRAIRRRWTQLAPSGGRRLDRQGAHGVCPLCAVHRRRHDERLCARRVLHGRRRGARRVLHALDGTRGDVSLTGAGRVWRTRVGGGRGLQRRHGGGRLSRSALRAAPTLDRALADDGTHLRVADGGLAVHGGGRAAGRGGTRPPGRRRVDRVAPQGRRGRYGGSNGAVAMSGRFLGSHPANAGGPVMAVRRAASAQMRALQLFSAPPTYYNEKVRIKPECVVKSREALAAGGIEPARVLVHVAYVLNTASPETEKASRAKAGLARELERSTALGVGACCFRSAERR